MYASYVRRRTTARSRDASCGGRTQPTSIGHHGRMTDPHDLQRFLDAQEHSYRSALAELRRGRKTSHWMWFVFPQVEGLGRSPMAQRFAISGLGEATAY